MPLTSRITVTSDAILRLSQGGQRVSPWHDHVRIGASIALLALLLGGPAWAQSAPYEGVGGKVEAFGRIAGTYFAGLAFAEVCGEDPKYKRESEETARNYLNANHTTFIEIRKKLDAAASQYGGDKERQRLDAEIRGVMPSMEQEAKFHARKQVVSSESCASILANLRRGLMDLKTQRGNEISLISK